MGKKLTANLGLKIISVIIGFLVWLIVVNIDNPRDTRVFTVQGDSVELLNTAYIDSYNKMCIQDDDPVTVRVTVTAERKTLRRLSASDIMVVADLQQAVSLDTDPVMVPITATCTGLAASSLKVTPQYLGVHLEDKVSQEFVVNTSYGESKPGKGYEVGTQSVSPEKMKITGPKSLMNKIDKVTATVNISGKTKDVTEDVTVSITDKNQDILSGGRMSYLTIDNNGKATVTTKFWRIQPAVHFFVSYTGEPKEGYQVERVTTVPDTVSVAGTEEALQLLREDDNTIWLTDEGLDITGKSEDIEQKVSISGFIPGGARLTSGTSEDVYVNIAILPVGAHIYSVASGDIQIQGLKDKLQVSFETDSVSIRVKALEGYDIADFDISSVKTSVNLENMDADSYEVPVEVQLPEGYTLLEDVTADIVISEITSVESNGE